MGKLNNKSEILYADKIISVPFEKSMFSLKNFYLSLKIAKIINKNNYDIIIIHTSLAAFFARIGIILCLKKPKLVVNTVHGYLFDYNSSFLKKTYYDFSRKTNQVRYKRYYCYEFIRL